MSAIAGMIAWCGAPAAPAVGRALEALSLHGRDGHGLWDGGTIALGWRQTILHQEDRFDRQPLTGGDGSLRLVFDGRIDNRADLARALGIAPLQSREWPDSAWVLAAFEKWGTACVDKLLGDFAFAVWNERTGELFLVRDHIGSKPLYFHRGDGFLMFASQPSALFTNTRVPREIDDSNFLLYLTLVRLPPGATIYRGIEQVPIGVGFVMSEGATVTVRHWDPKSIPELRYKRDDDYVEAFRSILDDSIDCRLRSISPVGSHLSSGWDSSTVTVTAARLLGTRNSRLTAFTAVPPDAWEAGATSTKVITNEGPIARAVVEQYPNIDHVLIRGPGHLDLSSLDRMADASELPPRTVSNVGWLERLNVEARDRGIRVMLGGAMGNRTVSYPGLGLLSRLLRHGRAWRLAREWSALRLRGHSHLELGARTFGPYVPDIVWEALWWWAGRQNGVEGQLTGLNPGALSEEVLARIERFLRTANPDRMDDRSARRFCTQTPDAVLIWGGGLAAYDIETREPLGDRRLMTFRAGIPERQFLSNGETKWLVRRAMEGRLPQILMCQPGRGLQAAEWLEAAGRSRALLRDEVERLAASERTESLFDIPALRRLMAAWPDRLQDSNDTVRYRRLLLVMSGGRFARRFEAAAGEHP